MEAADLAGYTDKVSVGLDVAASEFKVKDKNEYDLDFKSSSPDPSLLLTGDELIAFYKEMIAKYPIKTIEDPFDQDDWANWEKFCKDVGTDVQVVGDDLTVTNPVKIEEVSRMECSDSKNKMTSGAKPQLVL